MKMKNITTAGILTAILSCPAFAEVNVDITAGASNPGCTNGVLQTYTGPTSLEAEYTANTINLKWYGADGEITSVQNASKTCTYDGSITLPTTNPTRTGYTFAGWQVRGAAAPSNPQQSGFDLSTWNYGELPDWDAQYTRWKRLDPDAGYTMEDEFGTENSSDLSNGEWAITFGNGTVKGVATCSTQSGNNHSYQWGGNSADWSLASDALTAGDYNDTDKQYCWCKATSVDTGSGYQSVASARWVFEDGRDDAGDCAYGCADDCARGVASYYGAGFRSALFGVTQ